MELGPGDGEVDLRDSRLDRLRRGLHQRPRRDHCHDGTGRCQRAEVESQVQVLVVGGADLVACSLEQGQEDDARGQRDDPLGQRLEVLEGDSGAGRRGGRVGLLGQHVGDETDHLLRSGHLLYTPL